MTYKPKNPVGRPTDYTPELAALICEDIENIPRGIDYICEQNNTYPHGRTVRRWLQNIPEFRPLYARAKQLQAQKMADEMLDVAYNDKKDWKVIYDSNGVEKTVFVPEAVNRAKLKVDTLKWQTEILDANVYGSKKNDREDVINLAKEFATEAMKELANKCLQQK